MTEKTLYTVEEAAALTGKTEKAIRRRLESGTLARHQGREWGRILISVHSLRAAGLLALSAADTEQDRAIARLIVFLRARPGLPFQTHELRAEAGYALGTTGGGARQSQRPPVYVMMSRQGCETALSTLRTLGLVDKTTESPPSGTGRPRNVWRWVGPAS